MFYVTKDKNMGLKVDEEKKKNRLGHSRLNNQGVRMTVVDYIDCNHIFVMFEDGYNTIVPCRWDAFKNGLIKDPYYPSVVGVGIKGNKYPLTYGNGICTKEYNLWHLMLCRCYDEKWRSAHPTYNDVTCCKEWLLFENFYEWLHSQENFDKWLNEEKWCLDKDILVKGNKIYSPETCCLVPQHVNLLFIKKNADRGDLPIGVSYSNKLKKYISKYIYKKSEIDNKCIYTNYSYPTPEDAFYLGYKPAKESYIKCVAQEEYDKGNITKQCYDAMMNYKVEITD